MTPREKEIALEAAGRSSDPSGHAKRMLEAEAVLRGERPPFVVWPDEMSHEDKAAWLEAQATLESDRVISLDEFVARGRSAVTADQPAWRLSKDDGLQISKQTEQVPPFVAALREIIRPDEGFPGPGGTSPEKTPGLVICPKPSKSLLRLKEWLLSAWRYRPERVLCVAVVLLLLLGISGSALWLALTALGEVRSKLW
ncbi:hypothetical protein WG219_09930 [Ectopseudomonas mendocina]|uniref:Uncharacterized protein n=1 Tax=Ectopseudomonas mendocina TaxID=300 RepID=A0ABZ2RTY0_ECTME